nr:MAG: RNA-dependent RNA polymerase [Botourmiaviridae sp.]
MPAFTRRKRKERQSDRGHSRKCRVFQQRTRDCVAKAVASWCAISGLALDPFSWEGGSCLDLARSVKLFLGREVSSDPSLQMGFQSIKKMLPDSCRCMESGMLSDLVSRLGEPPRSLPQGYLSFVKKEVRRLFPKGWDSSYEKYCLQTCPPLGACVEAGRAHGGSLSVLGDHEWFLSRVLNGEGRLCPYYAGELLVVQSAGKPRPLSKFPAESVFLKPLHKLIYGNLSKRKWLLRGRPTSAVLDGAGFVEGEELVSGDYKSATDNLPIEVMETALAEILASASFVPANVKELALRACRPILFSESESLEVTRGQMMGSLLSFPFLCLQNYLSFRWSLSRHGVRGRVPVLINGDDILFQKTGFFQTWLEVVGQVGLEVEATKTSVELEWGTINSTLLRWKDGHLVPVWSPRFGMFRPADYPGLLGKSFLDFLDGSPKAVRYAAGREWFKWHLGELRSASVSLPSLGFRGLLAKRLATQFHLLDKPAVDYPRAAVVHHVGFSGDFVSQVPVDAVDSDLVFQHSIEVAAGMWSCGWAPADRTREAIRSCLDRTAAKGRRYDYPSAGPIINAMYVSDLAFPRFAEGLLESSGLSRREVSKAFLAPFPPREFNLLVSSLAVDLSADFGRGPLPSYSLQPRPGEFLPDEACPSYVPSGRTFVCCG